MDKTIQLQESQQGVRLLMVGAFPLLQESWMNTKASTSEKTKEANTIKSK